MGEPFHIVDGVELQSANKKSLEWNGVTMGYCWAHWRRFQQPVSSLSQWGPGRTAWGVPEVWKT